MSEVAREIKEKGKDNIDGNENRERRETWKREEKEGKGI